MLDAGDSGLSAETERILRERGVENRDDVSPSVAIPLIAAAINEDRQGSSLTSLR
jgi:hypothetical protein